MVRCPKCQGVNTKADEGIFYCEICHHAWYSDPEADKLHAEWVELDKSDRLIAQTMGPGGTYRVQNIDANKMLRRTEVAKELTDKHQSHLDLSPDIWYRIFQDAR